MHKVINNASDLPADWNTLAGDNLFLTIPFLRHLEISQKRKTEYHLFFDHSKNLDSLFVLFYYPDFPFFKNTALPFTVGINMIYYPVPLSGSTIILGTKTKKEVESVIKKLKGFTLLTNIPKEDLLDLPYELSYARCTLTVKWKSMDDYLESLRSHYRYKYLKTIQKTNKLIIKEINPKYFNQEHYRLYENVYAKTDLKINKANPAFFQSEYSRIITISAADKCIGFVQLIANGQELVFSLIGLDYSYSSKYNLYLRLLLEVIRYGIHNDFELIDLGQTTYDTKLKLGSSITELYIQVCHRNKLLLRMMLLFRRVLLIKHDYSKIYNVFKEEGREN